MTAYEEMMNFAYKLQLCKHSGIAFIIRRFASTYLDQQEEIEKLKSEIAILRKAQE